MSAVMLHAKPDSTDPSTNRPIPNSSTGLRPITSAYLPYRGTVTACVSR